MIKPSPFHAGRLLLGLAVTAILSYAVPIAITGPIQWTSGSGGNGHTYQLFFENTANGGIRWTDASAFATSMGGHLVTLTSSAEEVFVNSTFDSFMPNSSGNSAFGVPHFWIGLYSPNFDGSYEWVTGETLSYTNWNSGEPNDLTVEGYVADRYTEHANKNQWNNLPDMGTGFSRPASYFVVETPTPEPSTVALLLGGCVLLGFRRKLGFRRER